MNGEDMDALSAILKRITHGGTLVGGLFLIFGMLLLVANIVGRLAHFIIPGSYEIFELIMCIPVAFALVHAAIEKGHVIVELIISRFPAGLKLFSEVFASALSFITWALFAWAGTSMAIEGGLQDMSETLEIPFLPFRVVWVFCLVLYSLTYLVNLTQALKRGAKK